MELKIKPNNGKVFSGVKEAFTSDLNSSNGEEAIENIDDLDDEKEVVKVFTHFHGDERSKGGKGEGVEDESHTNEGICWRQMGKHISFNDIIF